MIELMARAEAEDLLPFSAGGVELTLQKPEAITWIAPDPGGEQAAGEALREVCGAFWPRPNRATGKAAARCLWFAQGQALLVGPPLPRLKGAALSDQSDGWTVLRLSGAAGVEVLTRLVPLDLRPASFRRGHVARSLLGHVSVVILRSSATAVELLVPRSMTRTVVGDLRRAMGIVAALSGPKA